MKIYLSLVLSMLSVFAWSQNITVKGNITHNNKGIEGVHIISQTTKKSAISGKNGLFSLKGVNKGETITFTHVSYETLSEPATPNMFIALDSNQSLDEVVISASRTIQKRKELPVAISSITRKKMDEINPTSVDQVLNQQSGVHMVDLGNEQHMMAIRQPISTKGYFLFLEDGIPIRPTGVFNHNALLEMNMNATERIEVIRGPYSSLYGSEAIGGAINFITNKPSKTLTGSVGVRADNNGFIRTDGKISNTLGKTGFSINTYHATIHNGIRQYGDFNKTAITGKLTHQFTENLALSNTVSYVDYFSEMSGSLDETKFNNKDYTSYHTFTFREAKALRIHSNLTNIWNEKHNTSLSLVYRDNTMKQNPSYRIADDTEFGTNTTGELNDNSFASYAAYLQHNIKLQPMKTNIRFGANIDVSPQSFNAEILDVYRNTSGMFDSYTQTGNYKSDYKNKIVNTGAYLTGDFEPVKNLKLNAGLRYDVYSYDFDNLIDDAADYKADDSKESFTSITPRLGATYNFNRNIGTYANYSKGFLPPTVRDLFRKNDVPLLDPSTFDNYEIGGWLSLLDNKIYIDYAAYIMNGQNEVVSVTTKVEGVTVRENKNVGETSHKGIEFGIRVKPIEQLSIRYNSAYAEHIYENFVTKVVDGIADENKDYSGNTIPGAPKWISNSGIDYKPNFAKGSRIGVEWQHVSSYFTDQKNKTTYDGYDTFNVRVGYDFKHVNLYMNIMNITDELFATRANTGWGRTTFSPGNPRTFLLGLKVNL